MEGRGLVKLFGPTRALGGIDVLFTAHTVTCIEGPNGSGKSTLLSLLGLLTRPTRGALHFGAPVQADTARSGQLRNRAHDMALRARIGVLAHAPMVYPDLSAHENLSLYAELHGLPAQGTHLQAVVERFGLGAWASRPSRTYSRGQVQRLSLARALLHEPRLLLLDEPSTGLDASSVEQLVTAVQAERARGAIVVLVTHDRALSERIADRRIELRQGRLVENAA